MMPVNMRSSGLSVNVTLSVFSRQHPLSRSHIAAKTSSFAPEPADWPCRRDYSRRTYPIDRDVAHPSAASRIPAASIGVRHVSGAGARDGRVQRAADDLRRDDRVHLVDQTARRRGCRAARRRPRRAASARRARPAPAAARADRRGPARPAGSTHASAPLAAIAARHSGGDASGRRDQRRAAGPEHLLRRAACARASRRRCGAAGAPPGRRPGRAVSCGSSRRTLLTPHMIASTFVRKLVRPGTRRLAGDPARIAARRGDLAVERRRELRDDERQAGRAVLEVALHQARGLRRTVAKFDLDASGAELIDAAPRHLGIRDRASPRTRASRPLRSARRCTAVCGLCARAARA